MEDGFCTAAAASGNVLALEWLHSQGCNWSPDTSYAAFAAGKLKALFWLRTQEPPCPWTPLKECWSSPANLPALIYTEWGQLEAPCHELLKSILHYATSCPDPTACNFFSDLVIELLEAISCISPCRPVMKHAAIDIAKAQHLRAMDWMCQHHLERVCSFDYLCTIFARSGNVPMMELLRSQQPPCPWNEAECLEEACDQGHLQMLAWLRTHGSLASEGCLLAAASGNLPLLKWFRCQDPPWPWDSNVMHAATEDSIMLQWILQQELSCPGACEAAAACPDILVSIGNMQLIKKLRVPIYDTPALCVEAAKQGKLRLLQELVQQQPACPVTSDVCIIAAEKLDVGMLRFLVTENLDEEDVLQGLAFRDHKGCFLALAQAGCPMSTYRKPNVQRLVEAWYLLLGLHRWIAQQDQAATPTDSIDSAKIDNCHQQACAPSPLLVQLGRLPVDLAVRIASEALVSPRQASQIAVSSSYSLTDADWLHLFTNYDFDSDIA